MNNHLKPCALCGCTKSPIRQGNGIGDYWLECTECGMSTRPREDGDGFKDWNRRPEAAACAPAIADTAGAKPVAQWQTKLREPILPECDVWINVSEEGARKAMEKWSHIYEVRALVVASPAIDAAPENADAAALRSEQALRYIDQQLTEYLEGMPQDVTSRKLRDVARAALSANKEQEVVGWIHPSALVDVKVYGRDYAEITRSPDSLNYIPLIKGSK